MNGDVLQYSAPPSAYLSRVERFCSCPAALSYRLVPRLSASILRILPMRHYASLFMARCREPSLQDTAGSFLSPHSAHCLSAGFLRAESLVSSPRAKRRYASSPCWALFP